LRFRAVIIDVVFNQGNAVFRF